MVRFSVPGRVVNGDEKVKREVATMRLIRRNTTVPVPSIIAWGLAAENPLELGPFIIADFIEGESLGDLLKDPESEILRSDLSDNDLDTIYRQIANIMLELSKLNFPRIGSLSEMSDGSVTIDSRPVTLRAHEIVSHGGVDVSCMLSFILLASWILILSLPGSASTTYSSAMEYFHYVVKQDQQHLHEQPNSVDDKDDAKRKYIYCSIFKALLPRFVSQKYNKGPFKLVCDDFRPGNMLVNNRRDLKIVGVIDWEWAYAGPYQLFFSPPRWLLLKRPDAWGGKDKHSMPDRYMDCFEKFVRALEEEEKRRPRGEIDSVVEGDAEEELSTLMRQSMADGKFWFNELIYSSFNCPDGMPWVQLRAMIPHLDDFATVSEAELGDFVEMKIKDLGVYNLEWAKLKEEINRQEVEVQALREKLGIYRPT
jgi:hypothetical protein